MGCLVLTGAQLSNSPRRSLTNEQRNKVTKCKCDDFCSCVPYWNAHRCVTTQCPRRLASCNFGVRVCIRTADARWQRHGATFGAVNSRRPVDIPITVQLHAQNLCCFVSGRNHPVCSFFFRSHDTLCMHEN